MNDNLVLMLRIIGMYTVNCEHFVVKLFSDSLAYAKIKRTKIIICAILTIM